MIVDHTANQRNGSEVSKIWQYGGERRRVDDGTIDREVSRDWQRSYLQWQGQRQGQRPSTAGPKFVPYAAKHSLLHHASGCTPNAEMTLDLEVNEVEVKVLTSLASIAWSTDLCSSGDRLISTSATDSDSAPLQPCSPTT